MSSGKSYLRSRATCQSGWGYTGLVRGGVTAVASCVIPQRVVTVRTEVKV